VPKAWPRFDVVFRYHSARYEIAVLNPTGVSRGVVRVSIDGTILETNGSQILLSDDGTTHTVEVMLG
jgi:cyclic beta-1,2-glucan synthetase